MGFLDRLLGRDSTAQQPASRQDPSGTDDDRAIERYRYLLQTAPPEQIEQAHEEAFAQLTPEQRREVLERLSAETPEGERSTADDPRSLARMATRAEMRQSGTLERSFGGRGGMGMGGIFAGSMLGSIAGMFIGTAIAQQMLADDPGGDPGADESAAGEQGMESDHGGDQGGGFDGGGFDGGGFGGGDFGGGF
ncbi:hypothetical protein [Aeromicrobium sp.]|uniref:hypothetical protein n=1 Tax=Aeromicrobium sp. TaxID=1871063 RepID=UPI003D6AD24B